MLKSSNPSTGLRIVPINWRDACQFIEHHHRHHNPPQGWKFGIGVNNDSGNLVGIIVVGRPVARLLDDGKTLEATRCCTDGTKNACSKLYAAAWRAARAMGYSRLITYTLATEIGTSLMASGWINKGEAGGKSWSRPSRKRIDRHPTERKILWEVTRNEIT